MALIRSPQSLEKVESQYRYGSSSNGNMKLRSYYLPPYQVEIIDILAEETGKGKAAVLREMIDEWCEKQLERERV